MQMQSSLGMAAFFFCVAVAQFTHVTLRVENRCVTAAALPNWLCLPLALQACLFGARISRSAVQFVYDVGNVSKTEGWGGFRLS